MSERAQGRRKTHRWLNVVWMTGFVVAAVLGVLVRDYLLVLYVALSGAFLWLLLRGYPPAERPAARLLFWTAFAAAIAVQIYYMLSVFARAT